ncbi:MAG TPA: D-Ala-D-Ala carboxypeptidase family metallohydrolase [Bacteroidales bacterium]|nr:D-Ala-D-Ala carboxypeptidase family metallohydrolase [Bacteroidales bacterium]
MNTKVLQENLVKLGFGRYLRPYGIDGKYGEKTIIAVEMFQQEYNKLFNPNILVDGIPGNQTYTAIRKWLKNAGKKATHNFSISEFNCKGTGKMLSAGMDKELLHLLETLRFNLGDNAVIINSGYRTPEHNRNVGGASKSQHLYGKAADIVVRNVSPSRVYNEAVKMFDGVGKYNTFTHVDTRGYRARF